LTHFNKLNNENKHEQIVAQKRSETKRFNVNIQGGVPVNPQTQLPNPSNTQTVTIETWVDF
jgi:selenophosphate synthetase-related protein